MKIHIKFTLRISHALHVTSFEIYIFQIYSKLLEQRKQLGMIVDGPVQI